MPSVDFIIPARNAERVLPATLDAIGMQHCPESLDVGVIVVNNGSTDRTGAVIDARAESGVRRVDHDRVQSRAAACNAGVAASSADYVFILDADCRLVDEHCLDRVAAMIDAGAAAGFGFTTGTAGGFLGRYNRMLEGERLAADWRGWTTACCVIEREFFNAVGGFSADYTQYGFEDRDLVCKLRAQAGDRELRSMSELRASHDAETSVREIADKMFRSGRHSSGVFRRRWPEAYIETGYARADATTASMPMRLVLRIAAWLRPALIAVTAGAVKRPGLPLAIGRPLLRLCSAASFFAGTIERDRTGS